MNEQKMTQALRNVKALIWDYDGVHYDYGIFPPVEIFDDVRSVAAQRVLPELSLAEARRIGEEGYKLYGDTVHNYYLWAQANGYDAEEVRRRIFRDYHRDLFNRIAKEYPGRITYDSETVAAFRRCAGLVQHGLATHSCTDTWSGPFLSLQRTLQFFHPKALIGLDKSWERKNESTDLVLRAHEPLGVALHETGFVEDSLENLEYHHEKLPDLITIFAHYGRPRKNLPSFVTLQTHSPKILLQDIARVHSL